MVRLAQLWPQGGCSPAQRGDEGDGASAVRRAVRMLAERGFGMIVHVLYGIVKRRCRG